MLPGARVGVGEAGPDEETAAESKTSVAISTSCWPVGAAGAADSGAKGVNRHLDVSLANRRGNNNTRRTGG
eukprot:12914821-Prorocentrum_lima.AAC.1